MIKFTRYIATCVLGAALLPGSALHSQAETQTQQPPPAPPQDVTPVGNPQLRDFELRGTRTLPAPAEQPAAPQPQQPRPEPRPPVVESRPPQPQPQAQRPAPAPAPPQPRPEEAPPEAAPPPAAEAPPPIDTPVLPEATPPVFDVAPEAPPLVDTAPEPAPAVAEPDGFSWLYAALAALAALLAFAGSRLFNRRRPEDEVEPAPPVAEPVARQAPPPRPAPPAPPAPQAPAPSNPGGLISIPTPRAGVRTAPAAPAPAPAAPAAPAPSGIVGIQVRPWLELEFKPDRAAATLTDTSVQYEITIRNRGNAPARNVRVEARMFNAGADQEREIGAFFGEPVRERTAPAVASIPARGEVKLRSAVSMPKEHVREITIEGRRLFVPMVAFNVIYDWGDNRSGQTSTSYLVGREAEKPAEKMGAFRLDLGPRLYRSVGQRQTKLARIV